LDIYGWGLGLKHFWAILFMEEVIMGGGFFFFSFFYKNFIDD